MALRVESTSVADGQLIAEIHAVATPTADGKAEMAGRDLSPHLRWSGEPEGTRSFAISDCTLATSSRISNVFLGRISSLSNSMRYGATRTAFADKPTNS